MGRIGWITLVIAGTCAGFLVGAILGRGKRPGLAPSPATVTSEADKGHADELRLLHASLEEYRAALAKKENEVHELRTELAQVGKELLPSFTPDEEKESAEYEEWRDRRRRSERSRTLQQKTRELRNKILQRKDPALRQQGLLELEALVKSDEAEDVLLGLTALPELSPMKLDKESLQPHVFWALSHEDEQVRAAALYCVARVYGVREHFDTLLAMLEDPSDKVVASAAWWVGGAAPDERKDEAIAALKRLLHDEDKRFREVAVQTLSDYPQAAQEAEDAAIEISREPEDADAMFLWFRHRKSTSAKVAKRLVEMYDEGYRETSSYGQYYPIDWVRGQVSEEAKPVAVKFCVRVARDSTVHRERTDALAGLRSLGDASVVPELEAIANGPDAEGMESQLAETIEHLRQRANETR